MPGCAFRCRTMRALPHTHSCCFAGGAAFTEWMTCAVTVARSVHRQCCLFLGPSPQPWQWWGGADRCRYGTGGIVRYDAASGHALGANMVCGCHHAPCSNSRVWHVPTYMYVSCIAGRLLCFQLRVVAGKCCVRAFVVGGKRKRLSYGRQGVVWLFRAQQQPPTCRFADCGPAYDRIECANDRTTARKHAMPSPHRCHAGPTHQPHTLNVTMPSLLY